MLRSEPPGTPPPPYPRPREDERRASFSQPSGSHRKYLICSASLSRETGPGVSVTTRPTERVAGPRSTLARVPHPPRGGCRSGERSAPEPSPSVVVGMSGKLDKPVPAGNFSLDFPGSQGSHAGHSGILQGDPKATNSGRFSEADFDRLMSMSKNGYLKRSDIGKFIAGNVAADPPRTLRGEDGGVPREGFRRARSAGGRDPEEQGDRSGEPDR